MPHLMDLASAWPRRAEAGAATGITNTAFPLGTASGVAIYGAIMHNRSTTPFGAGCRPRGRVHRPVDLLNPGTADAVRIAYAAGMHWVFVVSCRRRGRKRHHLLFAIDPQRDAPRQPVTAGLAKDNPVAGA